MSVLDEQQNANEDADKHIGGLSNAGRAVRFEVMSDDVDNDWVTRNRRPMRKSTRKNSRKS